MPTALAATFRWFAANPRETDAVLGLAIPLCVLVVVEAISRRGGLDAGWHRMQRAFANYAERPPAAVASRLPARIVAVSMGSLGLLMVVIAVLAKEQQVTLAVFSALLLVTALVMAHFGLGKLSRKSRPHERP
ncbi:MAG: hypothetical protein JW809_02390 [Pirellulales bacterium]|nr:hypothetical protein [Pirellulales bacterium]